MKPSAPVTRMRLPRMLTAASLASRPAAVTTGRGRHRLSGPVGVRDTVSQMRSQQSDSDGRTQHGPATGRVAEFGVDLYGPIDLATGLGASARGFARALHAAGVPLHLVPTGEVCGGHTPVDPDIASDPRRFPLAIEHINADTTDVFLHRFGHELRTVRARVAVWYWELAAFRPDWISRARHYDEIWVASEFGRRAVAAVTNVPVHVVPPPVTLSPVDERSGRGLFGIPEQAFAFLYVFDHTSFVDRKNPLCLVDAFLAEFAGDLDVCLVLKVSHAGHNASAYRRLEEATAGHSNVLLLTEMLDDADLAALFAAADCYVSPHRTEGFGLTVAEAMLRARPVIATGYGATADFLTAETGYPIDYTLVEIEHDLGPYLRGHVWADPSREHLGRLLREVVADPAGARTRGEVGRQYIEEHYSPAAAGLRIRARLEALFGARADG